MLDQLASPEKEGFYEIASELEARLVLGDAENARETCEALGQRVPGAAQTDYRG